MISDAASAALIRSSPVIASNTNVGAVVSVTTSTVAGVAGLPAVSSAVEVTVSTGPKACISVDGTSTLQLFALTGDV